MNVNNNRNGQILWVAIGMSFVALIILVIMGIGITHKEKTLLKKNVPDSLLLVREIRVKDSLKYELDCTKDFIGSLSKLLDSMREEMVLKDSMINSILRHEAKERDLKEGAMISPYGWGQIISDDEVDSLGDLPIIYTYHNKPK